MSCDMERRVDDLARRLTAAEGRLAQLTYDLSIGKRPVVPQSKATKVPALHEVTVFLSDRLMAAVKQDCLDEDTTPEFVVLKALRGYLQVYPEDKPRTATEPVPGHDAPAPVCVLECHEWEAALHHDTWPQEECDACEDTTAGSPCPIPHRREVPGE